MSKQTLQKWVPIVIEALDERLIPELIVFPSGRELHQVMRDFECLCHLPCVAGAIDGTFIELTKPSGQHADVYWCYKNKISILLLAVVDATGRFIFTDIGRPGSVGDAAAFRYSSLSDDLRERKLLSADEDRVINGVTVQPYLLGDDAFPLIPSLMKAYGGAPPPGSMEKVFNDAVIQGRRVVECAFGRCKARWRVLLNRSSLRDVKLLSNITSVCCALHNYCETQKLNKVWEGLEEKWLEDVRIDSADEGGPANRSGGMVDATAAEIRDALRDYLKDNYCSY